MTTSGQQKHRKDRIELENRRKWGGQIVRVAVFPLIRAGEWCPRSHRQLLLKRAGSAADTAGAG